MAVIGKLHHAPSEAIQEPALLRMAGEESQFRPVAAPVYQRKSTRIMHRFKGEENVAF
jgi:hypothetical protein